jgi:hypothetical protein
MGPNKPCGDNGQREILRINSSFFKANLTQGESYIVEAIFWPVGGGGTPTCGFITSMRAAGDDGRWDPSFFIKLSCQAPEPKLSSPSAFYTANTSN